MSQTKIFWAILLATCILFQTLIVPVESAPSRQKASRRSDPGRVRHASSGRETPVKRQSSIRRQTPVKRQPPLRRQTASRRQSSSARVKVQTSRAKVQTPVKRQTPLTPTQFALAATRFIVMLPFMPMLMFVPGATGVLMPMFLALQDRLQTIAPNVNLLGLFNRRPGSNPGIGYVSNQGVTAATLPTKKPETSTKPSTNVRKGILNFRQKRALLKSPTKAINEGVKEIFEVLRKTDDVFNLLTSSEPDCRKQAVCKLHQTFDPSLGKFLGNVFDILKLDSKVDTLEVSETTRTILRDTLKAANTGLVRQDCVSVYSKCDVVTSSRRP